MNGIETSEGMPLDQIARKKEGTVVQFHSDVGLPIGFKLPAGKGILGIREVTFAEFTGKAGIDFGVGNLGGCDGPLSFHEGLHQR